jgi:hypothetical protein
VKACLPVILRVAPSRVPMHSHPRNCSQSQPMEQGLVTARLFSLCDMSCLVHRARQEPVLDSGVLLRERLGLLDVPVGADVLAAERVRRLLTCEPHTDARRELGRVAETRKVSYAILRLIGQGSGTHTNAAIASLLIPSATSLVITMPAEQEDVWISRETPMHFATPRRTYRGGKRTRERPCPHIRDGCLRRSGWLQPCSPGTRCSPGVGGSRQWNYKGKCVTAAKLQPTALDGLTKCR